MKKNILLVLIFAAMFLACGHPYYTKIQPGMTLNQVETIIGKKADFITLYNGMTIHYYFTKRTSPTQGDKHYNDQATKKNINSIKDSPFFYSSLQALFSSNNILLAFAYVQECKAIKTISGNIEGK